MFGRRGDRERREPVLGTPGFDGDLRLSADDRPTIPPAPLERAPARNRKAPPKALPPPRVTRRRHDEWDEAEEADWEDEPRVARKSRNRRQDEERVRERGRGGGRRAPWP